jgi:hypothetical protein
MLGIVCVLALVWLIIKLLITFRTPRTPLSLKTKVLSLFLGLLMGFVATVGTIYAFVAGFFILNMPNLDEYNIIGMLYLAACFSFVLSYVLSKITWLVYRRGLTKLILYSALIVSVYFTLQPIGYNWLRLLSIVP